MTSPAAAGCPRFLARNRKRALVLGPGLLLGAAAGLAVAGG